MYIGQTIYIYIYIYVYVFVHQRLQASRAARPDLSAVFCAPPLAWPSKPDRKVRVRRRVNVKKHVFWGFQSLLAQLALFCCGS